MLRLKAITKDYTAGDTVVHALRGVDLSFRRSEFVSILGPSGCGKTTLLNIIGGLDHYTAGEMYIDGVSTKNYTARDWDTYRNHRIGFVFQSYNLIPHQTILENVELALTISGVTKAERVRRAKSALDKVGLAGQYGKKPNQLSGGQCQRVAIARALVNDPEILLADEPTGALDTVTSKQIMDLIREVAKDCLVIMVTHNPELAEQYSSRIIRFLDGEVVSDTDPFDETEGESAAQDKIGDGASVFDREKPAQDAANAAEDTAVSADLSAVSTDPTASVEDQPIHKKGKKSKLSFWAAFKLSARNLRSKLKRSLLVCFAGSIGIIGVALVLAVSAGVQGYIRDMQEDMLSGNPITVSESAMDMSGLMSASNNIEKSKAARAGLKADGTVDIDLMVDFLVARSKDMQNIMVSNNITEDYVKFVHNMPKEHYAAITHGYGLNLSNNLYTDFAFEGADGQMQKRKMSITAATETYTEMLKDIPDYREFASYIGMMSNSFELMPDNTDFILSQYDVLSGAGSKIPTAADEVMIVVDEDERLTDLLLAQFGYLTQQEFFNIVYRAMRDRLDDPTAKDNYDENIWKENVSYEELLGKTFTWYPNETVFKKVDLTPERSLFTYIPYADKVPAPQIDMITVDDEETADISWTYSDGAAWDTGKDMKITAIIRPKKGQSYVSLDSGFYYTEALAQEIITAEKTSPSPIVVKARAELSESILSMKKPIPTPEGEKQRYVCQGTTYSLQYVFEQTERTATECIGSGNTLGQLISGMMSGGMAGGGSGGSAAVDMEIYTLGLRELGGESIPSSIKIYPTDFSHKNDVTKYLKLWNGDGVLTVDGKTLAPEDREDITYVDNLSVIINLINSLIQMITVALVAFTALSLVVSTVMVAIITYVSVMERIKEIGVIRSLGGRKRDVSNLFIAETFIIGGLAGLFGIAVTYLFSGIINLIVKKVAGIATIATLSPITALIMVALSIALTLISGLIPARLAAKKDPVDALRSE